MQFVYREDIFLLSEGHFKRKKKKRKKPVFFSSEEHEIPFS